MIFSQLCTAVEHTENAFGILLPLFLFWKQVKTGDVSQARWLPPNQAWPLGRVNLDKLMWLNAPAPSCVFHGIPLVCHLCLRHVVLWKIHKMQVVLKQCNGLLKRVSSSTQAQCATCLHGNWELNVSLVLFFFNVSLACLWRMVLCPIGYHQPNWPQWCKVRWLAAAWMQSVVCHGNDSVVCCLWLQNASFIRRIFFCGRAGKTAPKPAAENHVSVFCVFGEKEWLVFTRSHVNLEPEFVIKTS